MKNLKLFLLLFTGFSMFGQDPSEGLMLHYEFDNSLLDATENNYDGTLMGPTFVEDRFGNPNGAISFDGIDDYVILPNEGELKPPLPVSFSFWIRYETDDFSNNAVFNTSFENDRSSGVYFNAQMATGNFAVNYGDGTYFFHPSVRRTFVSTRRIEPFIWLHVVAVVSSASDMKIYIDCSPYNGDYSGSGGDLVYSDTPGNLGRRDRDLGVPPLYFKGQLDDFKYYNRALTFDEVQLLCFDLSVPDQVQSDAGQATLILYPNPVTEVLKLEQKGGVFEQIEVFNVIGQRVYSGPFTQQLYVGNLPDGMYLVKSRSEQSVSTVWFVKH